MKMNRLFIQLVLLCMGLASVNLFGQKKPLITESATITTSIPNGGNEVQTFDFYFSSYYDGKQNKSILPNHECGFYIIRFELHESQIVVKTIESEGLSGKDSKETVLETYCFDPSICEFDDYLIGDGLSVDYFIISSSIKQTVTVCKINKLAKEQEHICISYSRFEPNQYHTFTKEQLVTPLLQQKQNCAEYKIEADFQIEYDALRSTLKKYSFARPCY